MHSFPRSVIASLLKNTLGWTFIGALALASVGCHTGTLPDPNSVAKAGPDAAEVIMRQLNAASDSLNLRKGRGEINDRQYNALISKIAQDYIAQAKDVQLRGPNARTWGKVYVTARDWKKAEPAVALGIKAESSKAKEDYLALGDWTNDVLQLAGIEAQLGKIPEAVKLARSVFTVPPKSKAAILTSVIYDVVPAAVGKGDDFELANLCRDAIAQHEQTIVDPNTDGGREFLIARPHHIQRAWEEAALLYESSGHHDLAEQALAEARKEDGHETRL